MILYLCIDDTATVNLLGIYLLNESCNEKILGDKFRAVNGLCNPVMKGFSRAVLIEV